MNRRGFLGALAGAFAGAVADPERLLWRPGAKTISIPAPRVWPALEVGDVVTFEGLYGVDLYTGLSTGLLQRFVLTGQPRSLWPLKIFDGPYRNVIAGIDGRYAPVPELWTPAKSRQALEDRGRHRKPERRG